MAAKKTVNKRKSNNNSNSQTDNKNSIKPEIISLITIGVAILIIISVFSGNGQVPSDFSKNAIGFLGGIVCWFLKGSFGIGAYVLPFGIIGFCSSAFFSENKKIKLSKFIMSIILFVILISFMHLVGKSGAKSALECFNEGGAFNGGFVGCIAGNALYSILGFGTYILFAVLAIILAVSITGKSFMDYVRKLYYKVLELFEKDELSYNNYNDDDFDDDFDNDINYNSDSLEKDDSNEKKNRKINKKWAGNTKKNNSDSEKKYLGKKVVKRNGKIMSITIPEKQEKNKNKISLFTDELKKNKRQKSSMPSFLSKKTDKATINATPDRDDFGDDDIIIKGFVSDNPQNNNFNNQNDTQFEDDDYEDSYFDSPEFQEKIRESFKERFKASYNTGYYNNYENVEKEDNNDSQYDYNLDNEYPSENIGNIPSDTVNNNIIYSDDDSIYTQDGDSDLAGDSLCVQYSDSDSVGDFSYVQNDDSVEDSADIQDSDFSDDSVNNETVSDNQLFDKDNDELDEDDENYTDYIDYADDSYFSDEFDTDENLRQAVFEYFNGDFGFPFRQSETNIISDIKNDLRYNREVQNKNANNKTDSNVNNISKSIERNGRNLGFDKEAEPRILQAKKQTLVNKNSAQRDISKKEYIFPLLSFLEKNPNSPNQSSREEILENSRILIKTLNSFNVEAKVNEISKGPTVTRYELSPGEGIKVSKILGLADNLALSLAAKSIRIEAPIPGKAAVGIEIPNKEVTTVYLSEVICDPVFQKFPSKLAFGIGKDITGNVIVADIAKMPHMLIAGRTGSGKSVCINTLITSIIYKSTPDEVKLIMVDPKVVELSVYNGIPHLLIPVVTDPQKAAGALNWAVSEMMSRYDLFASTGVRNIKGYNNYCEENNIEKIPQIIIIIDELADLMMAASKEVEAAICRLAQLARAAGIHLIIATQRPSVDVITGLIKANIPSRIAFAVSSATDSRTILDMGGADKLLGMGDMLFKSVSIDSDKPLRIQGAFISDKEVENIVSFIKENNPITYDDSLIEKITSSSLSEKGTASNESDESDELIDEAIAFIVKKGSASGSMLQRKFKIGYNRAARIIEELEERGIVGPETGTSKPRAVLMNRYEYEDYMERRRDYI